MLHKAFLSYNQAHLSSFQMTVESNYAIAIATLSDWLTNLAPVFQPVFQPMRGKTKTNRSLYAQFFLRFEQVTRNNSEFWLVHRAVCSRFDWSEWLLWYWFFDSNLRTALSRLVMLWLHCPFISVSFRLRMLGLVWRVGGEVKHVDKGQITTVKRRGGRFER